ncbi:MAG: non-homologous end-joining DNA ligase [Opitutus sp.]
MPRKAKPVPEVAFSNLSKVFFPATGFTKGELIKYYIDVAPVLLPHFRDRPVTLIRMPDGVRGETFYEKNAPGYTPGWVQTTQVPRSEGGVINYLMLNDAPTLAWCANNAAIELHPFLHKKGNIQCPTHIAFDLDPGEGADLLTCIEVAHLIRDVLGRWKLQAFPKVSGSKGLQLYVPLNTPITYDVATPFAKAIADLLHEQKPEMIVSEMSKALRVNRVFIDWSQNNEKKTTVGPYSVRGKRDEPFVSTPVSWEELKRAAKKGRTEDLFFSPADVLKRVDRLGDLFAPVLKLKQKIPKKLPIPGSSNIASSSAPRSLQRYAEKRDFSKTAEPKPRLPSRSAQGSRRRFVIQKHAASHLHYDFRLEMDDVLKSWAVPKGLSTEVGVKRSAFQTEDHPLDYFSFEGTIPEGQYGGGTVMVWDIGTYDIIGGNYWKGDLKLWLSGKKLSGEWHIFRIKSQDEAKPVWLIQKADKPAKPVSEKQENRSVLTGRTLEQIAKAKDAVWQSNRDGQPKPDAPNPEKKSSPEKRSATRPVKTPAPKFVEPMTAREVQELPDDDNWIYEIKFDGYRGLGIKHADTIHLLSRKNKNLAPDFPTVVNALGTINADSALLDGEIVAITKDGKPSFQLLQNRKSAASAIVYYAFDLLFLAGEDWRERPLDERKARLAEIVTGSDVMLSASVDGPADKMVAAVRKMSLEGVVAKRRDSPYESGERSGAWVKLKLSPEQEFVVGGYKRGSPLESLVVGHYDGKKLLCAGKVRQGLNPRNRRELAELLKPLRSETCPFSNLPDSKKTHWGEGITLEQMKEIQWVKPELVVQASFAEWTSGGNLRHGTYKGVRDDKTAREVVRE